MKKKNLNKYSKKLNNSQGNTLAKSKPRFLLLAGGIVGFLVALVFIILQLGPSARMVPSVTQSANSKDPGVKSYRQAPSFSLKDSQGVSHSLSEYRGSWVILHFWASWCPPCLSEISIWLEAADALQALPVQWIAVSLDQSWSDALRVLPETQQSSKIHSLLDETGQLPEAYGTFQFPETYLISPDQKILHKWVGPQEWSRPELIGWLRQLIRQSS